MKYIVESCAEMGPGLWKVRAGASWKGTWVELVGDLCFAVGSEVTLEVDNGRPFFRCPVLQASV